MVRAFTDAYGALAALQSALESVKDYDYFGTSTVSRGGHPSVNIFKKETDLVLTAEIPGIRKEDLNIEVKGDLIRLSGERNPDFSKEEVSVHRLERYFGRFDRTMKLPYHVDSDKVVAALENGVLHVTLPQAETDKPKKINIG